MQAASLREKCARRKVIFLGGLFAGPWRGVEYGADPRHQAIVVDQLGLSGGSSANTPYGPEEHKQCAGEGQELGPEDATRYRALVARLNHLAMGRSDIQLAVKESANMMSTPRDPDRKLLKRIGRYLRRTQVPYRSLC